MNVKQSLSVATFLALNALGRPSLAEEAPSAEAIVERPDSLVRAQRLLLDAHAPTSAVGDGCTYCYGRWVEALMAWTENLVHRVDRFGVLESPWKGGERTTVSVNVAPAHRAGAIARLRPTRFDNNGYGLVAHVSF